jgi:lipoprotein-releasing system ATP-binding protein
VSFVNASGLNKTYTVGSQAIHVLRDLELEVAQGEMLAIVGASGVGKSTLLHLLGGLDRADSGTISVAGRALTTMTDAALVEFRNRNVGFVFQFHHLLREFTALENVMMPLLIARTPESAARSRAEELLATVGLAGRMAHRPGALSGGEQQRVAVARALAADPLVLLADEPSGNLDYHNSERLHELFSHLAREFETALVVVTHNRQLAGRADRVMTLDDGRLVPLTGAEAMP